MIQNFVIKLKDGTCSNCFCDDQKFLFPVLVGGRGEKFCTSCVLYANTDSFCPTCFAVHDFSVETPLVTCSGCRSSSHPTCFSSVMRPPGTRSLCSSCINSDTMLFTLRVLKDKKMVNGFCKGLEPKASQLLLTAAKIAKNSLSKLHEESMEFADTRVTEAVLEKKSAIDCVVKAAVMRNNGGPSLIDSSTHSEECDSSETWSEHRRAPMEIDPSEYSSINNAM